MEIEVVREICSTIIWIALLLGGFWVFVTAMKHGP